MHTLHGTSVPSRFPQHRTLHAVLPEGSEPIEVPERRRLLAELRPRLLAAVRPQSDGSFTWAQGWAAALLSTALMVGLLAAAYSVHP